MNISTPNIFKLPPYYNEDQLDNTAHLKKLDRTRGNIEILYPEVNNCNSKEYDIDNFDEISLFTSFTEPIIREHKYQEGLLFDRAEQWGSTFNPYVQHHIQGHVHFGKVIVFTHSDTEQKELDLETNIQATSLSEEPIVIKEAFNGKFPPSRQAIPRNPDSRTEFDSYPEFEIEWVRLVRRNLHKYLPPVGNGLLKTGKELYPREFYDFVKHRKYFIDEIHGVAKRDLPRARYDFLQDFWASGKLYKEKGEDEKVYHFEYHYVNCGRKRSYNDFQYRTTNRKREAKLNKIAYKKAIKLSEIVTSDKRKEQEGLLPKNTRTILIQNTNQRKTRTSKHFKRNSDFVRDTWHQETNIN